MKAQILKEKKFNLNSDGPELPKEFKRLMREKLRQIEGYEKETEILESRNT